MTANILCSCDVNMIACTLAASPCEIKCGGGLCYVNDSGDKRCKCNSGYIKTDRFLDECLGKYIFYIHNDVLSYMYSKQPTMGLTQEWFRKLSFPKLECGVHDRLHFYPLFGSVTSPGIDTR